MLLGMLCAHARDAARITERIDWTWAQNTDGEGVDYRSLEELGRLRDRETKAAANLQTKLRLTPQSQEPPAQGQGKGKGRAPWETPAP
jgi:hypothetical protein